MKDNLLDVLTNQEACLNVGCTARVALMATKRFAPEANELGSDEKITITAVFLRGTESYSYVSN